MSYFSHGYNKMAEKNQRKGGKVCFDSLTEGTLHHGREAMAAVG